ncbi:MAG: endonuclease, partial [Frankiales bacterium]|nr:endonuclease [Frankiales bacterium]
MPATTPLAVEEQRAALVALEEHEARRAQLHAEGAVIRAEIARLWSSARSGFAEMEVAGTALVGQVRAARELDDAQREVELFPQLHALVAEGLVFVPTVEAVLRATVRCTPEVQAAVDTRLAAQLIGTNVTDVRRLVAHTVLAVEAEIDPQLTEERRARAKKDARVWQSPGDDGMTSIGAIIDAVAGRRWALDFDQLVKAQVVLDKRVGASGPSRRSRSRCSRT